MTKKHYEAIGAILASYKNTPLYETDYSDYRTSEHLASDLADYFATDNKNFDRQRFLEACGIVEQPTRTKYCTSCGACTMGEGWGGGKCDDCWEKELIKSQT